MWIGAVVEISDSHPSGDTGDSGAHPASRRIRGAGVVRGSRLVATWRRGVARRLARPRATSTCRVPNPLMLGGSGAGASLLGAITGRIERDIASDRELRDALRGFLDRFHIPLGARYDIVLAVGEAITNAVRYGEGEHLEWQAIATREQVTVEIKYRSQRFDTAPTPPDPNQLAQGGRGILIMRSVTDDLEFRFQRGGVRVRMVKKLAS